MGAPVLLPQAGQVRLSEALAWLETVGSVV